MYRMERKEIIERLEKHKHWINHDVDNWESMRLSLAYNECLCDVDLSGLDLQGVDFRESDLSGANLENTNLSGADLREAYLSETNLKDADLSFANMWRADLYKANLEKAILYQTNLSEADLSFSNLLHVKGLSYTNLSEANLNQAINIPYIPYVCPEEGSFIGYKLANYEDDKVCIVKLEIPEDAKRNSNTTRKCRCNKAKVLEITSIDMQDIKEAHTFYDIARSIIYRAGEIVEVKDFDNNRWNRYGKGINFFMSRYEVIDYYRYAKSHVALNSRLTF